MNFRACSLRSAAVLSFTLSFFAVTTASAASGKVIDRLEASVNNLMILKSDLKNFRDTVSLRAQLDPLFAGTNVAAKGTQASDSEITEFLVDEKLIAQQFPVTDTEVEQEVNSIQANNKIDRAHLKAALKEQGYTFDDYFDLIRTSAAKRNLIDRDIRTKVSITDDDVKNYYYNNLAKNSTAPLAYKVKIITLTPSNYKVQAAAKEAAERALAAVKSGEAFEDVAKRLSDDATAATGGDLGTLTDDQMSPAIRDPLKKMQIGQVSGVLGDYKSRFFILKLIDITSTQNDQLLKMTNEIRSQLAATEYQRQVALWIERQRQNAFIHRSGESSVAGLPQAR
ncbi:MAG: peptidylprolyl isomerase [Methylotenera sp.]|nr:peptidylprolyl isomerase [Oligoflexia bacterium]